MKKRINNKALLFPQPVLIISTYDENQNPDVMNAAWGGVADSDKVYICLDKTHKTTKNILKNKQFTLTVGTEEFVKNCDFVGIVSQNDDDNKIDKSGFTFTKSEAINAPIINEIPLSMECELISYDEENEYLFARIINTLADDTILNNKNSIDIKALKPLIYECSNHKYYGFGEIKGNAFKDGLELK